MVTACYQVTETHVLIILDVRAGTGLGWAGLGWVTTDWLADTD